MKSLKTRSYMVWSAKVILILSLAVIITVTALVFALSDRSVLVETGITLSVLALCLFMFLTTGLYLGVHLERVNRKEIDQVIKKYQERGTERPAPAPFDVPLPETDLPDRAPTIFTHINFPADLPAGETGSWSGGGSGGGLPSEHSVDLPKMPSLNKASAVSFGALNSVSDGLFSILNGTGSLIGRALPFGGGGGGGGGSSGSGFGGGDGGDSGGGCSGDIGELVIGIIVAIVAVIAFAVLIWLLAQFFAALPVFIAVLFWIFYRALRVVFARSHACQGRLLKSAGFGLLYTVLYTSWTFILLGLVSWLSAPRV